jgi:hypothetical protein
MTPATAIRSSAVVSGADSITVTTFLTTTAIISPSQPLTMTTVATTTLPLPAELTGAQTQPVLPKQPDVVRLMFFAYLGAYLYSLIELVRRYNTFDLQPQVYASILVRMVAAVILVFIGAATIFNAPSTYQSPPAAPGFATLWLPGILAFVIGAFPSRGLDWFRRLADPVLTGRSPATPNVLPVDNLQGMSTWHAARLEQIGIDDAQNLAGADLRKLLLTTQFDTQVIVNWVDQAILYSKVGSDIIKFREKNIPTFTALRRAIKEIMPEQDRSEADRLAIQLGLQNFTELQAFAVDAGFPNYHNLAEYYARSAQVTSRYAQEAQEAIIGQARFENFDEAIAHGEDFRSLRLSMPDAGLLRTLGTAYYQRAMSRKRARRARGSRGGLRSGPATVRRSRRARARQRGRLLRSEPLLAGKATRAVAAGARAVAESRQRLQRGHRSQSQLRRGLQHPGACPSEAGQPGANPTEPGRGVAPERPAGGSLLQPRRAVQPDRAGRGRCRQGADLRRQRLRRLRQGLSVRPWRQWRHSSGPGHGAAQGLPAKKATLAARSPCCSGQKAI